MKSSAAPKPHRHLTPAALTCAIALAGCDPAMNVQDSGVDAGGVDAGGMDAGQDSGRPDAAVVVDAQNADAADPTDTSMIASDSGMDAFMSEPDAPIDGGRDVGTDVGRDAGPPPAFVLQLLHASDGEASAAAIDDLPRFAQVLDGLRDTDPTHTLTLSSGDNWIPGPWLDATTDAALEMLLGEEGTARADIAAMNAMGFQASAFGNHEFDQGATPIFGALARRVYDAGMPTERTWPGAQFPYLSSNLTFLDDPATTSDLFSLVVPPAADPMPGRISRSTILTVDGVRFGIVGVTTPTLETIASPGAFVTVAPPDDATPALAAIIQTEVDALSALGIDHIILLSHMQQIAFEQELATRLRDVDIIVAGGSNTILADDTDRLRAGDRARGLYPNVQTSASGEPVAVVNTDGNWRYVGRLVIGFDADGVILPGSVDRAVSGIYAADAEGAALFPASATDPSVTRITQIADTIESILVTRESSQFGYTDVFLEGRRSVVRTEETNLGNLVCDSMLWQGRQVDPNVLVAVHNAGGIRASIGLVYVPPGSMGGDTQFLPPPAIPAAGKEEGEISQFDITTALSFNNQLVLITLTRTELRAVLERAVTGVMLGATPGNFGQWSGVRLSYDATRPDGDRIRNAAILDPTTGAVLDRLVEGGVTRPDATRPSIRIVTLNFMANCTGGTCTCGGPGRGGDGYPLYAPCLTAPDRRDLFGDAALTAGGATFAMPGTEQDALAEYLLVTHATRPVAYSREEVGAALDRRVQNLAAVASDTVFSP